MTTSAFLLSESYYRETFSKAFNPYIRHEFIAHNAHKVEGFIHLANTDKKPDLGIVLGIRNNCLLAPFSAPFGGFHYRHELVYSTEVDAFIKSINDYFEQQSFDSLSITLPPSIYSSHINAKVISSFFRTGFTMQAADVTNFIPLHQVGDKFSERTARDYYAQAVKHGLTFNKVTDTTDLEKVYAIIHDNRARMGRPIFMTLDDVLEMEQLWPVDFFLIEDSNKNPIAAAIFYQAHHHTVQAVLWGDSEQGRPLRAMDFMIFELCRFYKTLDYAFIDLGISTEKSIPNPHLLRFKESHESYTDIRYTFSLHK